MLTNASPLERHLDIISPFLSDRLVSEISINKPGSLFIEKAGEMRRYVKPELTFDYLNNLSILLGNYNQKPINAENPHFSGVMPGGHRIQIVRPPVTEPGVIALSIRKQVLLDTSLDDLMVKGFFNRLKCTTDPLTTIKEAILDRKNILISGGTGTGKTTFMNALVKEIPAEERLIVIEDTREIIASHPNQVFLTSKVENDNNKGMLQNLKSALRLRPDRILIGEVRGEEAAMLLEAIATGHDGAIFTLHASTPELALARLAIMAERGGMRYQNRQELMHYIYTIVDYVIQLKRSPIGYRYVSDIFACKEKKDV